MKQLNDFNYGRWLYRYFVNYRLKDSAKGVRLPMSPMVRKGFEFNINNYDVIYDIIPQSVKLMSLLRGNKHKAFLYKYHVWLNNLKQACAINDNKLVIELTEYGIKMGYFKSMGRYYDNFN